MSPLGPQTLEKRRRKKRSYEGKSNDIPDVYDKMKKSKNSEAQQSTSIHHYSTQMTPMG